MASLDQNSASTQNGPGDDPATRSASLASAGTSGADAFSAFQPLRPLARLATGRSGADIERLVREARRIARREKRRLEWQDLAGLLGEGQGRSEKVRWRMAVHEAGHALVQLVVGVETTTLISINAAHGGMVQTAPVQDRPETEEWLMGLMTVCLAGRAAEELVFTNPVAGCGGLPQSDLAHATDIATKMETMFGYGRHQPLLYRPVPDPARVLALDAGLAARVNERLEECHTQAKSILGKERQTHLWLARKVLRHGVLEGAELDAVLAEARQRIGHDGDKPDGSSRMRDETGR